MTGLAGKRVLVTRAEGQGEGPAQLLRARGAEPVVIPSIVIGPPDDDGPLRQALARASEYDWVVFTSANGVDHAWRVRPLDRAALAGAKVAVVGSGTREALEERGLTADLEATEFRGAALADALLAALAERSRGARVLLLRAEEASDVLPGALRRAGVNLDVVASYRTRPDRDGARKVAQRLAEGSLDVVVFSSGSTVDSVCDALGPRVAERLGRVTVACIGPVTRDAVLARGARVDVLAKVATFASVIEVLDEHFRAI